MAKILVGLSALSLVLIGVATMLFWRGIEIEDAIERSWSMRERANLLADELRQTSDDLTRMARTYAATGDERYRQYFQEILDIRNGSAPRPQDYHEVYWDLVTADGERPRPADAPVALRALMEHAGITPAELDLLAAAEDQSNELTLLENSAFDAVGSGEREAALQLLHAADYHQAKARIMRPLLDFFMAVDARSAGQVADLVQRKRAMNRYVLATIVTLLALTAVALVLAFVAHRSPPATRPQQ